MDQQDMYRNAERPTERDDRRRRLFRSGADSTGTPLTVEEWTAEPPEDRQTWDHEVELDLDLPSGRLEVHLTTGPIENGTVALSAAGPHRLRVSARFSHDHIDRYRLRLWPRTADAPPVIRRAWPGWSRFTG